MRHAFHASILPLLFCLALVVGVVFAHLATLNAPLLLAFSPHSSPLIFFALVCLILAILLKSPVRLFFALFSGLIFGFVRASGPLSDQTTLEANIGRTLILSGTVAEDPVFEEGRVKVTINDLTLNYSTKSYNSQAYLILSSASAPKDLVRSDRISVRGALQSGFTTTPIALYKPELLAHNKPDPPDFSLALREAFSTKIADVMSDATQSKLAMGYLLGRKSGLPLELNDALKSVGLSHAVVASGYNLAILVNLAKRRMRKFSRVLSLFVALFLLFAFVSVTGLSPSMLRAALVSSLSLVAWFFGRKFHPARLLLYAAALSLIVNPSYLLNLGWQLSFASFAGVMLLGPIITRYLYRRQTPSFLAATTIETLAAQLSCLPLTLASFGTFSGVSLLANLLVVPTIPLVMLLTFFTGACSVLSTPVPLFAPLISPLIQLSSHLLSFHLKVIDTLGALPWASYDFPAPDYRLLALGLPLLLGAFYLFRRAKFSFKPLLAKTPKDGKIYAC